jgi:hypothetical protein
MPQAITSAIDTTCVFSAHRSRSSFLLSDFKSGTDHVFVHFEIRDRSHLSINSHGKAPASESRLDQLILEVRGQRVLLDISLAALYGVTTGSLVQAVKRNSERFPSDFMFQLTKQEVANLKSQTVISSLREPRQWGGRRSDPYAFSEQGVAMLSSVLRSARAIAVNIAIMRAFVRLRQLAAASSELTKKLDELESRVSGHDSDIENIVRAPAAKPKRPIGFISPP